MTAVKKAQQTKTKREIRATRRPKAAKKQAKREIRFARPTEGGPVVVGDNNG